MDAAGLRHRIGTPGLELLTPGLGSSKPVSRPITGAMSSAATPTAAEQQHAAPRRRRQTKSPVTRRSAIQLLVGVLIVGAIPIVSLFAGYMFHPAYVLSRAEGEAPILRIVKRPALFEGRFRIDAPGPASTTPIDVAVVSVLMMVLLERMRG